jgi:hypothetical protein
MLRQSESTALSRTNGYRDIWRRAPALTLTLTGTSPVWYWSTYMSGSHSGNYPIERRAGEIDRLHTQARAMAPDTLAMLDRIGPMIGWACLDIGCGPGGRRHGHDRGSGWHASSWHCARRKTARMLRRKGSEGPFARRHNAWLFPPTNMLGAGRPLVSGSP